MQDKIHKKPSLDIKRYSDGERYSINYDGEIQIITLNHYNKLVNKANEVSKLKGEIERLKYKYNFDIKSLESKVENGLVEQQRLRNQLKEQERKFEERIAVLKSNNHRVLSDKDKQLQRAEALLNRQGKGRPGVLANNHKYLIERNLNKLKVAGRGGDLTIKDVEAYLVKEMGYTGGYEPVRAYVSELLKGYR